SGCEVLIAHGAKAVRSLGRRKGAELSHALGLARRSLCAEHRMLIHADQVRPVVARAVSPPAERQVAQGAAVLHMARKTLEAVAAEDVMVFLPVPCALALAHRFPAAFQLGDL